jgi:sugar phosphate isomerase/epimerase
MLTVGSKYIVCPYMPDDRRVDGDAWKRVAEELNGIGETCAKHGLTLCYHNHSFEFEKFNGEYGLDILYGNSDPKYLQAELDLYWVKRGGESPVEYVEKYANRLPLLHIKDMANDAEQSFAEFGNGILDWDAILPAAEKAGAQWYIVEQDVCKRPCLESVEISFKNLQARGLA